MRFSNKVSLKKREVLQELYKEFIRNNFITKQENKELLKWIYNGNSPYENPDMGYDDYCKPLSFIDDLRIQNQIYEDTKDMTTEQLKEYFDYEEASSASTTLE